MPEQIALKLADLPANTKKTVTLDDTKILLVRTGDAPGGRPTLFAVEAECPHAKAPLEKGAVCNGRLVCPWHTGTFALDTGTVLEPPPLRDLKRYPVRLSGEEILVDATPIAPSKPTPTAHDKHLVFAGGGAATAAALCYLRDQGFAGKTTVIEPETDEPIDRTQLSKQVLSGQKPMDTLPLFTPPKDSIEPPPPQPDRIRASVTTLHREDRSLTLSNGETVSYDALLLATGGRPRRLHVDGADLPHVFTLRHSEDLVRMEPLLNPSTRVALVGDSFIAFEAASALRERGLHVTVIAHSKLPFANKFGPEVAQAIVQLHRSHGTALHTEAEVTAVTPVAVTLSTGAEIPADLVLLAIGVEPVTNYAPDFSHGEKGGFALGRNLRLAPNLWAAGDIASVDGTRIEHWRLAQQHGRTAAEAMFAYASGNAHGPAYPFSGVPFFWTFHFGKRFSYAGHADTWDTIAYDGDPTSLNFLAFYVKDSTVAAVFGCGRDTAIASLMEPLRDPLTLEAARKLTSAAA